MYSHAHRGAFLRDYVVTMRPYLLFVSGITGLAGLSMAPSVGLPGFALLGTAFFLSYGFGQALTDCSQRDTDAISAPYRPLVRGTIRVRDVALVSLAGLALVGAVLVWHNRWNLALVLAAVAGLATYTPFKRRWWAGPFYNAAIVTLLLVAGYAAGIGEGAWPAPGRMPRPRPTLPPAFWPTASLTFFAYANFVLAGYFKDIAADRAAGYRTLPVVSGRRMSAAVSDGFAALTVLSAAIALSVAPRAGPAIRVISSVAVAGGIVATLVGQVRLHRVRHDAEAHRAIEPVVHAYLLLLSGVAAAHQPAWAPFLAVFYAAFVMALRARPECAQI